MECVWACSCVKYANNLYRLFGMACLIQLSDVNGINDYTSNYFGDYSPAVETSSI